LQEQLDKAEGECHSKSEVAQAINKLQLGLQEVVSKQSPTSIFDVDVAPELQADPLATSPAVPTTPAARTIPAGRPIAGAPITGKPASAAPAWMAYWPLAALLAVILIALPILTFLFTGVGRNNKPTLITDDPVLTTSPQPTPSAARVSPNPVAVETLAMQPAVTDSRGTRPASANRAADGGALSGQTADQFVANKQRVDERSAGADKGAPAVAGAPSSESTGLHRDRSPAEPAIPFSKPNIPNNSPAPAQLASSGRPAEPPQPARKWTTISTADGRGADAMVQIGSSQKFGAGPSIGIRSRGEIETNHSYLRFDLAAIEETREWADEAELVLSVIGDEPPIGASVRVFAVNADMWPEEKLDWKKSFSHRGLDSLPLLAEYTVGPGGNPQDENPQDGDDSSNVAKHVIRITSTQLAGAIANSPHDTLTLVIAGSGMDDSILRFASRESSASAAPQLAVRTPSQPPQQARGQTGGRGGVKRPAR
jgi:hypothetical protein